ncbi:unnamed protein product [Cuscuta epithymum]|uniref:Uncharacterized protein n=1 Tax=Cuscuta epithymum TaxID=186058 RepID=A0AAV0FP65_9ASTE|nr:unnamed protein product [Cuscuta epithymum]
MKVFEEFHMNGGIGEASYSNNSLLQREVLLMTKPITTKAIASLYTKLRPETISIADLGCSSGPNTLLLVSELMQAVDCARKELRHRSPEFHIHLNDLPSNDFNTIFRSLSQYMEGLKKEMGEEFGPCFISGVPGTFYGRLFPTNALNFVHSSYSLMWLSQVPQRAEENMRNIYLAANSPPCVVKAYYEQFERDFLTFLMCRSEEIIVGGRMVLTILGRNSENPCDKESCHIWELLAIAPSDLVDEDLIEDAKLNTFNLPHYTPSLAEVKCLVEKEGSFSIISSNGRYIDWNACGGEVHESRSVEEAGKSVTKCMRAVSESLLVSHFGVGVIEETFHKYQKNITDSMSKGNRRYFNVTVSLVRNQRDN